jgi:hypothetical protein
MRESRTYGPVRGARGNSRPYREGFFAARSMSLVGTNRTSRGGLGTSVDWGRSEVTGRLAKRR